jgi:hypothetical protein
MQDYRRRLDSGPEERAPARRWRPLAVGPEGRRTCLEPRTIGQSRGAQAVGSEVERLLQTSASWVETACRSWAATSADRRRQELHLYSCIPRFERGAGAGARRQPGFWNERSAAASGIGDRPSESHADVSNSCFRPAAIPRMSPHNAASAFSCACDGSRRHARNSRLSAQRARCSDQSRDRADEATGGR